MIASCPPPPPTVLPLALQVLSLLNLRYLRVTFKSGGMVFSVYEWDEAAGAARSDLTSLTALRLEM